MINDDLRGRMLAHVLWSELEKIGEEKIQTEENKTLEKTEIEKEEFDDLEEKDSIIGTNYIRHEKEKNKVRGAPIIKDRSEEGLRYNPNTGRYEPDDKKRLQLAQRMGYIRGKSEGVSSDLNNQIREREGEIQKLRTLVAGGSLEEKEENPEAPKPEPHIAAPKAEAATPATLPPQQNNSSNQV